MSSLKWLKHLWIQLASRGRLTPDSMRGLFGRRKHSDRLRGGVYFTSSGIFPAAGHQMLYLLITFPGFRTSIVGY